MLKGRFLAHAVDAAHASTSHGTVLRLSWRILPVVRKIVETQDDVGFWGNGRFCWRLPTGVFNRPPSAGEEKFHMGRGEKNSSGAKHQLRDRYEEPTQ